MIRPSHIPRRKVTPAIGLVLADPREVRSGRKPTVRQRLVLDALTRIGRPATVREIARASGVPDPCGVNDFLLRLGALGLVKRDRAAWPWRWRLVDIDEEVP